MVLDTYEDFKVKFYKYIGLDLNCYKEAQMKRRIESFLSKKNCSGYAEFMRMLEDDRKLCDEFTTYLTINVSEFYRNPNQWSILETVVIPELIKNNTSGRIKIWSAACSTGDEPYTLAMVFNEMCPRGNFEIIATDIDMDIIRVAKEGRYSERSIKGLPNKYIDKYFSRNLDGEYIISDRLKQFVTFKQHNLLSDRFPSDVDLVVCRNVLIYFTEDAKDMIYRNMYKSLKKDGVLFIGSTEQIMGSRDYGLQPLRSFFYRKF
ncbi:MAG: protein-glutamate O-methyltransferase CheR [Eubacterium sp.]|nr:protein-glutamate O-methyltransferase CheR [Eubacterium sp.]